MATEYLDLDDALYAYAEAVEVPFAHAKDALLNVGQLELSEDEIFELAVGVADSRLTADAVEARLRPAVLPL